MKLYYHKTDGGAEYLMDNFIICSNGHKEGVFEGSKYIIRIDGDITKDAELNIKDTITDKEFLQEQNEEEISSVIESFLNRWKDKLKIQFPNEPIETFYKFLPTDKNKGNIIKQMIKEFKEYRK